MSEKFEVVSRDAVPPKPPQNPLVAAVLATAGTENAIKVALNGTPSQRLKQRLYMSAKSRGLALRTRTVEEGTFYAWVIARAAQG